MIISELLLLYFIVLLLQDAGVLIKETLVLPAASVVTPTHDTCFIKYFTYCSHLEIILSILQWSN